MAGTMCGQPNQQVALSLLALSRVIRDHEQPGHFVLQAAVTNKSLSAGVSGILSAFTLDCFLRHVSAQTDRQTNNLGPEKAGKDSGIEWHQKYVLDSFPRFHIQRASARIAT
jgi:hypothetical protein